LSYNVNVAGTQAGAPAFPTSLATATSGPVLVGQSITAVDPAFRTQSAWLSNVQVERALNVNTSVAVGYVNAIGRNLPVLMDVNLVPSSQALADGRPIFSPTRVNPTFDHINLFQSIGDSRYNAFTLSLTRRLRRGFQTQVTYTLARGTDNAPLGSTYIIGSGDDRPSDPTNLDRDEGVTPFNQTHTLTASAVLTPEVSGDDFLDILARNNQLALIFQGNSGLPFNIRSNLDLNRDGLTNDRPLGLERNSGRLGTVLNLDLRYSRFVPLARGSRAELFFEAKNLFNRENVSAVNRVITTDIAGNPLVPIPDPFPGIAGYDQRIMQIGFKVGF